MLNCPNKYKELFNATNNYICSFLCLINNILCIRVLLKMGEKLPSFFKLYSVEDLIRLGKDNDGGYLVTRSSILKATVLVSLGINDDWSFERDLIKKMICV